MHAPWIPSISAALLLSLLLPAMPVWGEALRYRIEGAGDDARANIRAYLGESPKNALDAERFILSATGRAADALRAIGIYDHDLSLSVNRDETPWRAVLTVREGAPLRYTEVAVTLQGEGRHDPALGELVAARRPAPGHTVHHGRYEALKSALQQLARERGYFDARFTENRIEIDLGSEQARLRLSFDTGRRYRFGTIAVDPDQLPPDLLQRLQPFRSGDHYRQDLLLELRDRLLRLGYFSSVIVLPQLPARQFPDVPLSIELIAAPRHSFEVGAGFSTDTRQRFSLIWNTPRINRAGHSQESRLRWSPVNPEARVTYSIPLDDPANDVLQLMARLENNEFGDLESRQQELQLRREFSRPGRTLSVHARNLREEWGVFSSNFDGDYLLSGFSLSQRTRVGRAVDPSRGSSRFLSAEFGAAGLGSDEDVLRVQGELTGIRRFAEHWRLVARAEAGVLWGSDREADALPPSLAFFAGGDNSIRGFGYQSVGTEVRGDSVAGARARRTLVVGGTRLVTGSLELQRYLNDQWRGAVFVDGGDAFSEDFDLNVGLGFGIHYLSPVGALRLELANPISERGGNWRLHINIGAEF